MEVGVDEFLGTHGAVADFLVELGGVVPPTSVGFDCLPLRKFREVGDEEESDVGINRCAIGMAGEIAGFLYHHVQHCILLLVEQSKEHLRC